jgi:hypothetical protein
MKVYSVISYFFILLLLFSVKDFIVTAISNNTTYEIRYETEKEINNKQKIYKLYVDGQYSHDVDYNEYTLLDSNGKTDYKYCALIEQAKSLSSAIILSIMIFLIFNIAYSSMGSTPFTHKNTKRIRTIGILQLALAIVPGLIVFVMKFLKFEYVTDTSSINGFYMFVIAFIIMLIAQVFDYGVKLQEDSDSIA